jgi:hypothetical protein
MQDVSSKVSSDVKNGFKFFFIYKLENVNKKIKKFNKIFKIKKIYLKKF